ncbi:MAG TPA: VOC family protein [Clostridia bacterium]|nr:VOC family protein [Clostridia bacterium]
MKRIIPEITVNDCKGALDYYKGVFGGEIRNVQMADGIEIFKGLEGKVIHSELHINPDCVLYLIDILGEGREAANAHLLLELDNEEEINRIYTELSKKGTVKFELQKTFWGALHAVVVDIYGNTWGLNYTSR